jgi:hypothetical protein
MSKKGRLFVSIFQLVIGLLAVVAFIVVAVMGGEDMVKWTVTLLLAIAYVVLGIIGIIDHKK